MSAGSPTVPATGSWPKRARRWSAASAMLPLESPRARIMRRGPLREPPGALWSGVERRRARSRERPLPRRAGGSGHRRDRRVQAPLSLRRARCARIRTCRRSCRAYERGGAVALSVLTEGPNFDGSLEDLGSARAACELPILRKDFIVDPYQLHEARAAGADAVLLIVAALVGAELAALHDEARAIGLDVLVEVHDRAELREALELGADTVGINNRDLRDFSVDVERTSRLIGEIPSGVVVVSESGIASAEQLAGWRALGVHAVLVGESLMRSPDPEAAVRALQNI